MSEVIRMVVTLLRVSSARFMARGKASPIRGTKTTMANPHAPQQAVPHAMLKRLLTISRFPPARAHLRRASATAAAPPGRFGSLDIVGNKVIGFREKPKGDGMMINAGFFVLSPKIFNYIDNDETLWEGALLMSLAKDGNLAAFHHHGFWQPMDTLRDKKYLEDLWKSGKAPWKVWP